MLYIAATNLVLALAGIALWGVGVSATVVIYQQTLLITGRKAPETATSIGVVLAQAGFAIGATIGGISIGLLGVRMPPLVALLFVLGAVATAATLRRAVRQSHDEHADEQASQV